MTTRWVSWCAVSSLPQAKKISLTEQSAINRMHIEKHNGELIEELTVPGESRSIVLFEDACARIEAYAKLRDLIAERSFDVLIYYDRSRIGRTAALSMTVVELCREAGILCYETESPPASLESLANASYDDLLIGAIKSVGAQQEIQKMRQRHQSGMLHRVKQGKPPGKPPFGYRLRYDAAAGNASVEIDPAPAAAIKRLFELHMQGMGIGLIAEMLNAEGAVAYGSQWTRGAVRAILIRTWAYAGFVEYNVRSKSRPYVRLPASWPALISETDARVVLAEIESRGKHRKLANTPYLLSGVVWCQSCGRKMIIGNNRGRARIELRCTTKHAGGWINAKSIMAAIFATIDYLGTVDLDAEAGSNHEHSAEDFESQTRRLDVERQRIATALTRADNAYTDGLMDIDRYRQQSRRLAAERDAIDATATRLAAERDAAVFESGRRQRLEEIRDAASVMLNHPNQTLANAWLRRFMRIWVADNKVVRVEMF